MLKRTDPAHKLHIELDTKHCELSPGEIEAMEESLEPLAAVVESFPVSDLYITVAFFRHSQEYHVKTSLILPGGIQFTGEHDNVALPAFERCVRKLVQKVDAYKARMSNGNGVGPKLVEGTRHPVEPTELPELAVLDAAIRDGDYAAFRREMSGFEESVRSRAGRWIQRYPDLDDTFGEYLPLDDLVEEVFLSAFERFEQRPLVMRLGDWLEGLIDPAMRSFLRHPEEELEAISYARTLREMSEGRRVPVVSDGVALDTPANTVGLDGDPGRGTGGHPGRGTTPAEGGEHVRKPR